MLITIAKIKPKIYTVLINTKKGIQ